MGAGTTTTSAPTQPNAPTQPFSYNYLMMLLNSGGYTAKKDLSRPTQLKRGGEGFNYFKEVGQPVDFTTLTPTTPTTPTTTPTTDTPPPTTPPPTTPPPTTPPPTTPPPTTPPTDTGLDTGSDTGTELTDLQNDNEAFEDYLESDDYVPTTVGTGSTTMDDAGADPFDTDVTSGDNLPNMDEYQEGLELQDELDRRTYESILEEMQENADGEISNQTKIDIATDRINVLVNSNTPSGSDERRAEEAEIQRLQGIIEDLNGVKNYGDPSSSMDNYLAEIADQDVRDRIKFEDLLARNAEFGEGLLTVREYNNLIQNRINALESSTMTVSSQELQAEEAEIKRLQGLTAQDALKEGYAFYVEQYNQFNAPALDLTLGEGVFTTGDPADNPTNPVLTGNPADDFTGSTVITDGTSVYEGAMSKEQFEQELFNQQGEGSLEDQYGEYLRNYKEEKFGDNPIIISDGDGFKKPDPPETTDEVVTTPEGTESTVPDEPESVVLDPIEQWYTENYPDLQKQITDEYNRTKAYVEGRGFEEGTARFDMEMQRNTHLLGLISARSGLYFREVLYNQR